MQKKYLTFIFLTLFSGVLFGYTYYTIIPNSNTTFENCLKKYRDSTFYENPRLAEKLQEKVINEFRSQINEETENFEDFTASKFVIPGKFSRNQATDICKKLGTDWRLPSIAQLRRIKYIENDSSWYVCSDTNQNDTIFNLSSDLLHWTNKLVKKGQCEYIYNPKTNNKEISFEGFGKNDGKLIPVK